MSVVACDAVFVGGIIILILAGACFFTDLVGGGNDGGCAVGTSHLRFTIAGMSGMSGSALTTIAVIVLDFIVSASLA